MARNNNPVRRGNLFRAIIKLADRSLLLVFFFALAVAWFSVSMNAGATGELVELVGPFMAPTALFYIAVRYGIRRVAQTHFDAAAAAAYRALTCTAPPESPLFLYLRPFSGTDHSSPEGQLSDVLAQHGILVAIGNKEWSYGAGKIVVEDDEWRRVASLLMERAALIFFLPAQTDSVQWEANQIFDSADLQEKTFWMIPKRTPVLSALSENPFFWFSTWWMRRKENKFWNQSRNLFEEKFKVTIPSHDAGAGYFLINHDRRSSTPLDSISFCNVVDAALNSVREPSAHPDAWSNALRNAMRKPFTFPTLAAEVDEDDLAQSPHWAAAKLRLDSIKKL